MIEIKEMRTEKEIMEFIKFPWEIYKGDKYWVPPLIFDMKSKLDEKKNPFWKHSEKKLFMAYENNKPVGRIAGIIDKNFIEFQKEDTGFFAFYESINREDIAKVLIEKVKEYLKSKGMKKMIGPTAPSTNDEMGFLYDGFDSSPFLMMPYNPPYYNILVEKAGLKKAKDLYAYYCKAGNMPEERIIKISEASVKRIEGFKLRTLDIKNFDKEIEFAREVYNQAWEKNWGFVPWTDEEFKYQCASLKALVVPEIVFLATVKERPVGMLIAVPNYYEVFKKLNGRFGPLEIIKFLILKNKIKTLRVMIMGVIKEFRNRGIEVVMYSNILKNGKNLGFFEAEFSWILEDNIMMCRAAETLGATRYKTYRVYEENLI